jgi:hypothetical protein
MLKLTVVSKMFLGAPLFAIEFSGDAVFLLGIFLTGLAFNMARLGVWLYRVWMDQTEDSKPRLHHVEFAPGARSAAPIALRIVRVRADRAGFREQQREGRLRLRVSAARYPLRSARVHGPQAKA